MTPSPPTSGKWRMLHFRTACLRRLQTLAIKKRTPSQTETNPDTGNFQVPRGIGRTDSQAQLFCGKMRCQTARSSASISPGRTASQSRSVFMPTSPRPSHPRTLTRMRKNKPPGLKDLPLAIPRSSRCFLETVMSFRSFPRTSCCFAPRSMSKADLWWNECRSMAIPSAWAIPARREWKSAAIA